MDNEIDRQKMEDRYEALWKEETSNREIYRQINRQIDRYVDRQIVSNLQLVNYLHNRAIKTYTKKLDILLILVLLNHQAQIS